MTVDNDSAPPTVPAALLRRVLLHRAAQRHLEIAEELGVSIRQAHAWLHDRGFFEARYSLTAIRRALLRAQGAPTAPTAEPDVFERADAATRGKR